ncbi:RNA-directed DNA polymerase [Microbaculum marinum]|uniref:RNA-directed DNA polymerase n=1 Tax=Microbaculum marinum TaxID=1764581 RepID=A0AAW9RVD5_9HYPH
MPNTLNFEEAARIAVQNIVRHGDTDIFPLPFESHAFYDRKDKFVDLVVEYDKHFEEYLARFPPSNVNALTPVSYYGFRWATQLDPIWNAHWLSCVVAISELIEASRIHTSENCVYSYRINPDDQTGDLFDRNYAWQSFMLRSLEKSAEYDYVVKCDVSEFYPRLGHHRLENALLQIAADTGYPKKIMSFLSNFSNTRSFGLPIGGPAARMLSELTINQIDRLLRGANIDFTRYADDFHIFANTREEAYRYTIFLSEKLFENQGLSLQKSKTRIMTAAEFSATSPVVWSEDAENAEEREGKTFDKHHEAQGILSISLRFDPYSPTAEEDYEALKANIDQFDIMSLLREELSKSRIHIALSRKIIATIRFLEGKVRDDAVLSIVGNSDILYPIISSALIMMDRVYEELGDPAKIELIDKLISMIRADSHIFRIDVHLCYALRVLQHSHTEDVQQLLKEIYSKRTSEIVRRDIILIMALWGDWYWLSDLRNRYRQLSSAEKRALLVASYSLKDEGKHWRNSIKRELNPLELFIIDWAIERVNEGKRSFPL